MVLGKTLESSLDCKEIKAVNPKGNHYWIFIARTDAKAEAPIFWPPDMKSPLIGTDPAGKDEGKDRGQGQRMRWLDDLMDSVDMNLSKFWEIVKDGEAWNAAAQEVATCWTQLSDWTTTTIYTLKSL